MKQQTINFRNATKALIKPRNENEDEPIHNAIEHMSNKKLQSAEEMDETTIEIADDKKESAFDQTNESNAISRK